MNMEIIFYILPILMASIVSACIAILAWKQHTRVSNSVVLMMLALIEWSLAYVLELGSTGLSGATFWAGIEYFGIVLVPLSWLAMAARYTGRDSLLSPGNMVLLSVIPLVTLILVWTNDSHGLIWKDYRMVRFGPLWLRETVYPESVRLEDPGAYSPMALPEWKPPPPG